MAKRKPLGHTRKARTVSRKAMVGVQPGQAGFTLIELAIVLLILGLIGTLGLGALAAQRINAGIKTTAGNQDLIKTALINFIQTNNRLPCPAVATLDQLTVGYGVEALTPGACDGTTPSGTTVRGVVPWSTLGLPENAANDGFNRRFTYLVDLNATNTTAITIPALKGTITVHSATPPGLGLPGTGNQINACSTTPGDNSCNLFAVAAVISHGPNGDGAFLPDSGTCLPLPLGTNDGENTDTDVNVTQMPYIGDATAPGGIYDDTVLWLTPNDLLTLLVERNTIKTVPGAVSDSIARIRNAAVGAAVSQPPGVFPANLPALGLPPTVTTDPWNRPFEYKQAGPVTQNYPPDNPSGPTVVLTIYSLGPNGIAGDADDTPNPVYTMTAGELRGMFASSGVTLPP